MGDAACRIVVVASSLDKGALLVKSITSMVKDSKTHDVPRTPTVLAGSTEPLFHPWAISNRYYAADVHFALHTVSQIYGAVFGGVPAVIVAWTKGEPFEEYMETVQKAMEEHDPEVLLAVRLPKDDNAPRAKTAKQVEEEDEDSVDTTLISYGFEYIDASEPYDPSANATSTEEGPVVAEGIPHLPRVIDALSTIMWPSMSSSTPGARDSSDDPLDFQRSQSTLEAIINRAPLAILQALEELDSEFNFDSDEDTSTGLYREAFQDHLASPISDSDSTDWAYSSTETSLGAADHFLFRTPSPTNISFGDDTDDAFGVFSDVIMGSGKKPKVSLGFEDDFTVFVSAPVDDVNVVDNDFSHLRLDSSGRTTPDPNHLRSADHTSHAGPLYHSLGSSSDLNNNVENS